MLIERSFRPIGSLAGLYWASVMSLDLVSSSSKSLCSIFFAFVSFPNFLTFFLQFTKFSAQLVALINKLSHLRHENHIGQMEAAELMIVTEVCICGFCIFLQHQAVKYSDIILCNCNKILKIKDILLKHYLHLFHASCSEIVMIL